MEGRAAERWRGTRRLACEGGECCWIGCSDGGLRRRHVDVFSWRPCANPQVALMGCMLGVPPTIMRPPHKVAGMWASSIIASSGLFIYFNYSARPLKGVRLTNTNKLGLHTVGGIEIIDFQNNIGKAIARAPLYPVNLTSVCACGLLCRTQRCMREHRTSPIPLAPNTGKHLAKQVCLGRGSGSLVAEANLGRSFIPLFSPVALHRCQRERPLRPHRGCALPTCSRRRGRRAQETTECRLPKRGAKRQTGQKKRHGQQQRQRMLQHVLRRRYNEQDHCSWTCLPPFHLPPHPTIFSGLGSPTYVLNAYLPFSGWHLARVTLYHWLPLAAAGVVFC